MPEIETETRGRVGIVRINRPEALNALNAQLTRGLITVLAAFDGDSRIGAIVIAGSERAFAAGADVGEMKDLTAETASARQYGAEIQGVATVAKPIVAAVSGHCLGGGLELAMMCDIVIAGDTARFGQPEITLGIMPGMGGTQRLPRAVGRARAMEMILTGRIIDAGEAERAGLVSRTVPAAKAFEEALKVAERIAALPLPAVTAAKAAVNAAQELPLGEGIKAERLLFHRLFDTADQKEGMAAFLAKRPPEFDNR